MTGKLLTICYQVLAVMGAINCRCTKTDEHQFMTFVSPIIIWSILDSISSFLFWPATGFEVISLSPFDVLTLGIIEMQPPYCSFGGMCRSWVEAIGLLIDFRVWACADWYVCNWLSILTSTDVDMHIMVSDPCPDCHSSFVLLPLPIWHNFS